jgi:hypothetical protein
VKKRLVVVLLVLIVGSLVLLFAWPFVGERLRTADLTLSAISQPRAEVVISGYVKNFGAPAFSLETLLIEEPGKEPYRRLVSLDAERRFDLTLGQPSMGTYRVALRTRKPQWGKGVKEGWLKTPPLVLGDLRSGGPKTVKSRDYDYSRLLALGALTGVVAAVVALVYLRPRTSTGAA